MEEIIENILNGGVEINKNVIFADKGDMYYRPATENFNPYGDVVISNNFYVAELKINSMVVEHGGEYICKKLSIRKKEIDKKKFSVKRVILQFPFCFSSNKNDVNGEKMKIKLIDDGGFMKNKNIEIEYRDVSSIDDATEYVNDVNMFLTCKYRKRIRPKYVIFINEKNEEILYLWSCRYFLNRWTECLSALDELEELVEYVESDERCKHIFDLYSDFIFSCDAGSENLKLLSLFACVDGLHKNIANKNINYKVAFKDKIIEIIKYVGADFLEEYKDLLSRRNCVEKSEESIKNIAEGLSNNLKGIRNCVMHGDMINKDEYPDIFFSGILGFENQVNKSSKKNKEINMVSLPYLIWLGMMKMVQEK